MDGFINFLKPPGMTSHDAVGYVRRQLGEKKVGHAGTLDPGAAGVLPVAVGRATRLIEYLDSVEKAYRAELVFGFPRIAVMTAAAWWSVPMFLPFLRGKGCWRPLLPLQAPLPRCRLPILPSR